MYRCVEKTQSAQAEFGTDDAFASELKHAATLSILWRQANRCKREQKCKLLEVQYARMKD